MAMDDSASLVGGLVESTPTGAEPWRDPALAPPWLREARQRLIDQPELPVASLARSLGRHPVHLARQFRSAFGRAPSQVRQNDRTARAIDQIVRSSRSLADIACAAGFSDQAHMTRVLNDATGWTPGGLRRVLAR
jgi:AraC family transcriptional regulator